MTTIRSIKLVADGALGSRDWLLSDYEDRANHVGLPTMPVEDMEAISHAAYQNGFQVGIHAIGDRANREVLDIFDALFDGRDRGCATASSMLNISTCGYPAFWTTGSNRVHARHPMIRTPWAIDRLGLKRIKEGAYMWRSLRDTGAVISNGTDVLVEPVSAIASFYHWYRGKRWLANPKGGTSLSSD